MIQYSQRLPYYTHKHTHKIITITLRLRARVNKGHIIYLMDERCDIQKHDGGKLSFYQKLPGKFSKFTFKARCIGIANYRGSAVHFQSKEHVNIYLNREDRTIQVKSEKMSDKKKLSTIVILKKKQS